MSPWSGIEPAPTAARPMRRGCGRPQPCYDESQLSGITRRNRRNRRSPRNRNRSRNRRCYRSGPIRCMLQRPPQRLPERQPPHRPPHQPIQRRQRARQNPPTRQRPRRPAHRRRRRRRRRMWRCRPGLLLRQNLPRHLQRHLPRRRLPSRWRHLRLRILRTRPAVPSYQAISWVSPSQTPGDNGLSSRAPVPLEFELSG